MCLDLVVHGPHVRRGQGPLHAIWSQSQQEGVVDDAAEHVADEQERQPAENRAFMDGCVVGERVPDPVGQTRP